MDCGRLRLPTTLLSFERLSAYSLSDFCLLHCQCANCMFWISDGWPFLLIRITWSITGDRGCGYFRDLSTGRPQIAQVLLVFRIIFLFISNATRCGPLRSALSWGDSYCGGLSFLDKGGYFSTLGIFLLWGAPILILWVFILQNSFLLPDYDNNHLFPFLPMFYNNTLVLLSFLFLLLRLM